MSNSFIHSFVPSFIEIQRHGYYFIVDKKETPAVAAEVEDDWAEEPFHPARAADGACEVVEEEAQRTAVVALAPEAGG